MALNNNQKMAAAAIVGLLGLAWMFGSDDVSYPESFGGEWVGEKHFEEYLPNKNDFYSTGLIAVAVGVGSYLYNRK
jgi:hypothetical protein